MAAVTQEQMALAADELEHMARIVPACADEFSSRAAFARSLEVMLKMGWVPGEVVSFKEEADVFRIH